MKAGWEVKPLGEVCAVKGGKRVPKGYRLETEPTPHPYISVADFTDDGTISQEKIRYVDPEVFAQIKNYTITSDDLYLSIAGTIGKTGFVQPALSGASLTENACKLVLGPEVDKEFLYYVTRSSIFSNHVENNTRTAAQPKLSLERLKTIPIPLPPLEEQQRIVAVLDEAFEGLARARENADVNLKNARELFGSALHVAFEDETISWNDAVLSDLGSVVTGLTPKTSDKGNLGDHLPFVKPGDFLPDGALAYDNQGLSEQGASVSRVLPAGSALMVCIGATIGKAGYSNRPIATNQQINAVVPKEGISGEYLYYQMLTPEFQADVIHGSGQATLPIINKGKWSKLTARLPSDLTKQAEIVDKLSGLRAQIDAASAQYKTQIVDINDLRQSLLQKAFAGKLT